MIRFWFCQPNNNNIQTQSCFFFLPLQPLIYAFNFLMVQNSPNACIIMMLMGRNISRYHNAFSFSSLISLLWNTIHHYACGWNAPRAQSLGKRTMYYIWLHGKKNIGCIIHNFNHILNLRLTVFHITSSQYLLKPSSQRLLFPGGLSLLPLMALGCISARDQISWRHNLFQLFINLCERMPAHAKSSFSHEMRHFHMLNHLSIIHNIPLKAED